MTIFDTNMIIKCLKNSIELPLVEIIVPDDLYNEYLIVEARHKKKIDKIRLASSHEGYSEAYFLKEYARMLNKFSGVSFAKMRGFADVSILALASCLITDYGKQYAQTALSFEGLDMAKVTIATDDESLRKMLIKEFGDQAHLVNFNEM